MIQSLRDDLDRLVRDGPQPDLTAKAEDLRRQMETPADTTLPAPASQAQIAAGEQRIGVSLPPLLRRLYTEVAHGGFGPGSGLLGFAGGASTDKGDTIEDLYDQMLSATTENERWVWPRELVPIADGSGVFVAVDTSTADARIVEFDFEELDEEGEDGGWSRAFRERSPSLKAWLEEWLGSTPTRTPQFEIGPQPGMVYELPEVTRAYWADMSVEERAEYGLPERGWGQDLFGDAWGDDPRDGSRD